MVTRKISTVKYGVLIFKIWSCAVNAKLRDSLVFSLMKIDVYTLRCGFGFVNVYAYAIILNLLNTERSGIGVKLIYLEGLL